MILYSTNYSYFRPYFRPKPQSHINGQPALFYTLSRFCWGCSFLIILVVQFCAARFKSQVRFTLWCWAVSSTTFC